MTNRAEKAAFALIAEIAIGAVSSEEALRKFGILGEHAVPALRDALDLAERPVVLLAAQALARIESRQVIAPLLNLAHNRRERDSEIVTFALRGVAANLRAEDTDRVLPFALEFREHPDPFVRAALAAMLGALEPSATSEELARLARDPDGFVAETAAEQVRLLGEGGDDLLARLGDPRGDVRLAAIAELLARPDVDDVIHTHLDTSLPKLRRTLLEASAERKSQALATKLLDVIELAETSDHDRALALRGVVPATNLDLEVLGRTAHRFSQVADIFVRAEAFAMGIRCGVPHADELIERALRDPDEHVQEVAAAAHAATQPNERSGVTPAPQPPADEAPLHKELERPLAADPAEPDAPDSPPADSSREPQRTGESFAAFAARESRVVLKDSDPSVDDQSAPTQDQSAPTQEQSAPTQEQSAPTHDQSAPTQEQSAPAQEQSAEGETPTSAPADDQNAAGEMPTSTGPAPTS